MTHENLHEPNVDINQGTIPTSQELTLINEPSYKYAHFPTFEDIGGLDAQKRQLLDTVALINNPDLCEAYDVDRPSAILLCGPGGVGKTELTKALTNELKAEYYLIEPSTVFSELVGQSNKQLKFHLNRANTVGETNNSNVVAFFDEFDGIFSRNAGGNEGLSSSLISEMKSLIHDVTNTHPRVVIVAATNKLAQFDPALLRAGRFEIIQIPKPDTDTRAQIFGKIINKKHELYDLNTIDVTELAALSEDLTGADIAAVLRTVRMQKLQAHIRGQDVTQINHEDIRYAITQHRKHLPAID